METKCGVGSPLRSLRQFSGGLLLPAPPRGGSRRNCNSRVVAGIRSRVGSERRLRDQAGTYHTSVSLTRMSLFELT